MIDFFIIGSARSGTTLLRTLLAGHPSIAVAPETYFTVPLLRRAEQLTIADAWRLMCSSGSFEEWPLTVEDIEPTWRACRPATVAEAVGTFFQAYRAWSGKQIIGDKTPYHCQHVDLLGRAFPQARFVVLERDGRAVARSVQDTHFGSGSFLVNAYRWSGDVLAVDQSRRRQPERFHSIRYEALTRDPERVLASVCAFLGLDFHPAMLNTQITGQAVLEGMRRRSHLTRVSEPVGQAREMLLPAQLEDRFRAVASPGLRVLGETVPPARPIPKAVAMGVRMREKSRRRWKKTTARIGSLVGRRPIDRFRRTPTLTPIVTESDSVAALILTYGSPEALSRCLAAVEAQAEQPSKIIVLDNLGCPPAAPTLTQSNVRILRSSANTGPAGGWADLIRLGLESGARWLWLLDDDCVPEGDVLRSLKDCATSNRARAVMPTIFEERTHHRRHYPAWVGPLLDVHIMDRVGLPREEIVWWAEDTEYLRVRLSLCGFPLTYCNDAVVRHSMARRDGPPPVWRLYYETRNSIWLRVRVWQQYSSRRHMWRLVQVLASLLRTAVRHPRRCVATGAVLAGVVHGVVEPSRQAPKFVVEEHGPRWVPGHTVNLAVDL